MASGVVIANATGCKCECYTGTQATLQDVQAVAIKAFALFDTLHSMGMEKVWAVSCNVKEKIIVVNRGELGDSYISVTAWHKTQSYKDVLEFIQQVWLSDFSRNPYANIMG